MIKFVVNQLPYYGELCPLWTGINIKSAQMKTHMNVRTLLRQRNSNKCSCTKKTPPIMKGGNAQ